MKTRWLVVLTLAACAGCGRWFHREAPEASVPDIPVATPIIAPRDGGLSPSTLAALLGEEEEGEADASVGDAAPTCPLPIHPSYCRRSCRNFTSRTFSMHARRVYNPLRAGRGTCGPYKVFAEDARGADGGAAGGLVEYFDATTNELVGAVDSRMTTCGRFGTIPTCKLEIDWGAPAGSLGGMTK